MNNTNNTAPHAHLIGAKVTLTNEAKDSLNVAWVEGVIAAVLDTPNGVGVHVCNPETGDISSAITLADVKLHESAAQLLQAAGEVNASIIQFMETLVNGSLR